MYTQIISYHLSPLELATINDKDAIIKDKRNNAISQIIAKREMLNKRHFVVSQSCNNLNFLKEFSTAGLKLFFSAHRKIGSSYN